MRPAAGFFCASIIAGGLLGYLAARIRLSSSPLQGRRWVAALGTMAGLTVGVVVSVGLALASAVFHNSPDSGGRWELLGPTILILLFVFVGFALRRD